MMGLLIFEKSSYSIGFFLIWLGHSNAFSFVFSSFQSLSLSYKLSFPFDLRNIPTFYTSFPPQMAQELFYNPLAIVTGVSRRGDDLFTRMTFGRKPNPCYFQFRVLYKKTGEEQSLALRNLPSNTVWCWEKRIQIVSEKIKFYWPSH